jgi:hypothetical protein
LIAYGKEELFRPIFETLSYGRDLLEPYPATERNGDNTGALIEASFANKDELTTILNRGNSFK